jgi:dTDP-L-rhamnose 4-epimerase
MKVLVTGGAGFIGSHTADALIEKGYEVRVLDSLEEPIHRGRRPPTYLHPKIEFIQGDVCDESVLLKAIRGCDVIYHFAAFQDYLPVFSRFFRVNAASTALIYELIVRDALPIRKVIVASSQAAMGEGLYKDAAGCRILPDIRPSEQLSKGVWEIQPPDGFLGPLSYLRSDETISNPQNQYGLSKISQENITLQIGKRYNIPSVALRYSIVQGPRQSFYNAYSGACRIFSLSFHQGQEPTIYEDGQQVRDFVNIKDVVDANLLVLEDNRADYQVFNVGGDQAVTVAEFAKVVAEVFGHHEYEPRPSGKFRFGDTRHIFSDVNKLKNLGWQPVRSVRDSVEAYRDWLRHADSISDILRHCEAQMEKLAVVRSVS